MAVACLEFKNHKVNKALKHLQTMLKLHSEMYVKAATGKDKSPIKVDFRSDTKWTNLVETLMQETLEKITDPRLKDDYSSASRREVFQFVKNVNKV